MKIGFDNLPAGVRASCDEDLAEVVRLGTPKGVAFPSVDIKLVALDRSGIPPDAPAHSVRVPGRSKPASFPTRCDWETDRQTFQLVEKDDTVWVVGGSDAGCLFGFYEVLERLTGVIWAGLTDEDVLFGATRPLPRAPQKPRFAFRCRDGSPPQGSSEVFLKWLSRNRYNMKVFTSSHWAAKDPEERRQLIDFMDSRCMGRVVGYHNMDYWMPEEELEKHPDWLGMRDGKRVRRGPVVMPDCPNLNAELPIQPCYSNEGAAELITNRMSAHIADHPEIDVFSIWPHDGVNNWCHCPDCVKKTPYEHMYDLAMRLLPKIRDDLPIELIAYSNLLNLPFHKLTPSDRVICMLCPYLRHFRHRIYDEGGPELVTGTRYPDPDRINPVDEREYGELFRRWSKVWDECGSTGGIFEYGGTFPDETRRVDFTRYLYFPEPELREDEEAWYAKHGVRYFYMCSIYKGWPDNFLQLHFNGTMWGTEETTTQLEARYYEAVAGENGAALRAALKAVAEKLHAEAPYADEIEALDSILAQLAESPQRRRYELWSEYVKLARPAREFELAGKYEQAIAQEEKVRTFLEGHDDELIGHVPVGYILNLSKTFSQRHRERITGRTGKDYKL